MCAEGYGYVPTLCRILRFKEQKMIEVKNLTKRYGSKTAVSNVSFTAEESEILGFLGPNGAGKSTTMNILTGYLSSTEGEAKINGIDILEEPVKAKQMIGYLPEQPPLYLDMTVMEYLKFVYGLKKCKLPINSHLKEICNLVKITDVKDRVIKNLSKGYKQRVGLAQALVGNPPVLILDEPTAVLTPQETEKLFNILRKMKTQGCAIIIITHKLGEVMDISDRVTILRKGKSVETVNTAESSEKQLTELMVGKAVELSIERPEPVNVKPILNVVDLTVKNSEGSIALDDVSFVINRGEILGVAGIAGSGQKELCETIAGLQKIEKGAVLYNKENIIGKAPKEIINLGISMSFIPEDRLGMGLIASVGMTDNMLLKTYKQGKLCFVDRKPAKALSKELIEKLEIKTPSTELPVRMLSGGNVQKVLLGREIHSEPDLLITAYPVRGLDINSSYLIYSLLNEQKKKNTAVLFIGEDLDVLLELCDRIMVLCHGKITGICDAKKVTKEQVGMMMTGSTMEEVLGIG